MTAKYGYRTVPADTVYRLFQENAQPHELGFSQIKAGLFGKEISQEIIHLLKLTALKGASYTIWWGASLSYIPHDWQTQLRWHRTLKMARFDLFETPGDYPDLRIRNWRDEENYFVERLHGEKFLKKSMLKMWDNLRKPIQNWFSKTQTLMEILARAREQKQRKWIGPHHYPSPQIVIAFTLARLGKMEDAKKELNEYIVSNKTLSDDQALFQALERIAP